jgi:hypothetical protein
MQAASNGAYVSKKALSLFKEKRAKMQKSQAMKTVKEENSD